MGKRLRNLTRVRKIPATATESNNFYFLVKVCGISPLDIPHMTRFQTETLTYQHNRHVEEENKEIKKQNQELERRKPKKARRR